MSTAWLRLSRSCNNRCGFCLDAANLDDRRLSRADIENQIDELARRGTTRAILSGGEPTVSPLLVAALRRLRVRGIAASMTTNGRMLSHRELIGRLVYLGLDRVTISLHGASAKIHGNLVGDVAAFPQTVAAIAFAGATEGLHVTVRCVVCASNLEEPAAIVALVAPLGVDVVELVPVRSVGRAANSAMEATFQDLLQSWEAALRAAKIHSVAVVATGFPSAPARAIPSDNPPHADDIHLSMLRQGAFPPSALGGLRHSPAISAEHGPALAAQGIVVVDLPLCLHGGGRGRGQKPPEVCGTCPASPACGGSPVKPAGAPWHWSSLPPRPRIAIVIGPDSQGIMGASTLPGLAASLQREGAKVDIITVWDARFDIQSLDTPPRRLELRRKAGLGLQHPLDPVDAEAEDNAWAWLREQRLRRRPDLTIVGGFKTAAALTDITGWTPETRTLVLDAQLLEGFNPSWEIPEKTAFLSPFSRFSHLYEVAGLPLHQFIWAPIPLTASQLTPRTRPSPGSMLPVAIPDDPAVDPSLLSALKGISTRVISIDVAARTRLSGFSALVLPWRHTRRVAPSPWWPQIAHASRRPIVAVHTWATADLAEEVTLVPAGDTARWIEQVRLAGTKAPAPPADIDALARRLMTGHLPAGL